jgi:hypothetical protein
MSSASRGQDDAGRGPGPGGLRGRLPGLLHFRRGWPACTGPPEGRWATVMRFCEPSVVICDLCRPRDYAELGSDI